MKSTINGVNKLTNLFFSFILLLTMAFLLLYPELAHASSTGMPWEGSLSKIVSSITGPYAFALSVLALVASFGALLFGGDMVSIIKNLIFVAMGISMVVFSVNALKSIFNVSSTLVM